MRRKIKMSEDLIRRSDAIKALKREKSDWNNDYNVPIDHCIERLNKVKSADRPQGKWKAKSFREYFCHNCGFSFDVMKCEFLENMKYCPNCGVPKGADDDNDNI